MPIGHSSGAVKQAGGVEFGNWGEIWTGDIKSAVISILMTFNWGSCITKRVTVNREEDQRLSYVTSLVTSTRVVLE